MNAGPTDKHQPRRRAFGAGLVPMLMALVLLAAPATARAADGNSTVYGASADHAVMGSRLVAALAKMHAAIPAFSRQTHLACSVCHYQFPALTPFGRTFKLNGYTMTGLPTIVAPTDTSTDPSLKLLTIPPMAFMMVGSVTSTAKAVPGTQNGTAQFPDQASVFIGGALTPNLGMFSQFTYAQADGGFGVDNIDIRYAAHHSVSGHDLLFGLDVNNNPTVQDVWNTVPAWGYPYMGSETAPGPMAASVIDGGLGQSVVGLGAYSMLDDQLYTEFSVYRSAPQGTPLPLDSTAANATEGVAPYWRVAWQHTMSSDYLMLGTFGLYAKLYPAGISGLTNEFTDLGFDAQWEHPTGAGAVIGHASYIHETQNRTADQLDGVSANTNDYLSTFRANVQLATSLKYGASLGYFQTNGTTDALLYQPGAVNGSANGSPNSQGFVAEVDYNTWQNTRVGLQYTAYTKFNGSSSGYDGFGRSASDNNTLYAYFWVAF
jgi:hypothetical protein